MQCATGLLHFLKLRELPVFPRRHNVVVSPLYGLEVHSLRRVLARHHVQQIFLCEANSVLNLLHPHVVLFDVCDDILVAIATVLQNRANYI